MSNLKEVLLGLDTTDNDNWTSNGQPRLDVLKALTGGNVTREDVNVAIPSFSRTNATAPTAEVEPQKAETQKAEVGDTRGMKEANILLDKATKLEAETSKKVRALREEADGIIAKIDHVDARKTNAHDIQAFQKSQFNQRLKAANTKKRMNEFLAKQSST